MFFNSTDSDVYCSLMEEIKTLNMEALRADENAGDDSVGLNKAERLWKKIKNLIKKFFDYFENRQLNKKIKKFVPVKHDYSEPNYFLDKRIAVYTCIFGKYDEIVEPLCFPNNIDYYIITDQELPNDSHWIIKNISEYDAYIENMTSVEKNRWFKMHPDVLFPEYEYSIYIDGNIMPVSDFTEFINRIDKTVGIGMFWHKYNNCVFDEALYNIYAVKKVPKEEIKSHVEYLIEQGMPEDYGMVTCNVIARQHHNEVCKRVMSEWWEEFCGHSQRDQMSFPFVLWKNGIAVSSVASLGDNVWNAGSLKVCRHK